jgi:hypothetical protein
MCNSEEAVASCCEGFRNLFLVNPFTSVMHSNGNCCRQRSSGWWVKRVKAISSHDPLPARRKPFHKLERFAGVTKMSKNRSRYLRSVFSPLVLVLAAQLAGALGQAVAQGAPLASSFPGPLWEVMTPKGGTVSLANAHLTLNVPGGSNHDTLLPSNQAVRVLQPIGNQDFDVAIKIDSAITAADAGTSQGVMVLAEEKGFITFGLGTDGTNISLTANKVTAGVADTVFKLASFNDYHNPMYLRLARKGSVYTAYYSVDGVVWTQATSFTDTRVPISIGPFAGNYNSIPGKAVPVVMAINWFNVL